MTKHDQATDVSSVLRTLGHSDQATDQHRRENAQPYRPTAGCQQKGVQNRTTTSAQGVLPKGVEMPNFLVFAGDKSVTRTEEISA